MVANGQRHDRSALILYGTETGNAQDIAEELGRLCERVHFVAQVSELNDVKPDNLANYDLTVFAVSTTGQGDFPADAREFWRALLKKKLPPDYLRGVHFTVFGLGDSSYPKFNWAARKLYKRLHQLGASPIYPPGEGDEQHPEGIDGTLLPWSLAFRERLLEQYPLPKGQQPIPEDVLLQPKWILNLLNRSATDSQPVINGIAPDSESNDSIKSAASSISRQDLRPLPDALSAILTINVRVTPEIHWQDVRHLTLAVPESILYGPGDVLSITPKNFKDDVDVLLSRMAWTSVADKPVSFIPTRANVDLSSYPPPPISHLPAYPELTLRVLLSDYLDITSIPRRSFFSIIAHFAENPMHKERLLEFTNPEFLDEFYDYATRPRRSIIEVLEEFDSVKIPWEQAGVVFPLLRARQFSIASGGDLKKGADGGTRFELLVAIVKYQTVIKKIREGVCTRYLAALPVGSRLKITLHRGGLNFTKAEAARPVVLIGPGTGLAPLRSMIWERAAIAKEQRDGTSAEDNKKLAQVAQTLLLFGCRNERADYFFKDEWKDLEPSLDLQVMTAFSRDQKNKVYVQDLIRKNFELCRRLLQDEKGIVYICGSSGKMPQAVREALIEIFQGLDQTIISSRDAAENYLIQMEKEGRYKQETW